jgi:hypothetical protein
LKFDDLFGDEEDKKILVSSAIISAILTILFAIFVYVYTSINP